MQLVQFLSIQGRLQMVLIIAVSVFLDSYVESIKYKKSTAYKKTDESLYRKSQEHYSLKKQMSNLPNEPDAWLYRGFDHSYFPVFSNSAPLVVSNHVAFSRKKPEAPPWTWSFPVHAKSIMVHRETNGVNKTSPAYKRKRRNTRKGLSRRNRHRYLPPGYERFPISPCSSLPNWTIIKRADRLMGGSVRVASSFGIGSSRVIQYFYVTECINDKSQCHGIDRRQFWSQCSNTKIWVKARIINANGYEDWAHIAISGSCNCKLFRKRSTRPRHILDGLI